VALHSHTGQSQPVTISSDRHRNDPAQRGSDSGETIVDEGGQNLVVGLWGQPMQKLNIFAYPTASSACVIFPFKEQDVRAVHTP